MKNKSKSVQSCLPNMFCIRNTTIVLVIILGVLIAYIIYSKYGNNGNNGNSGSMPSMQRMYSPFYTMPIPDVLENPYAPPLRDDRYNDAVIPIPINVRTQGPPANVNYRQVGLLTRVNGKETMLPLMGRPLQKNRDKWQFYTMSDKNNSVKLPISFRKKSCTSEYGCDNIYNGDTVYVEGYKDAFRATIYDNAVMEYL
uniref:Uncharacterized protein n=1 Tax=viral metagenome TaxID=1070528 RepID=A0A6C0EZV8_9ZZZZ